MASSSEQEKGEHRCCLKCCVQDPEANTIAQDCRRVEVKSFEPKKKREKLLVNWENDGSAIFHSVCWDSLVKATKSGSELTDIERSMIVEAKKTAEFHDSDLAVAAEAARIASIFRSCRYPIAFTGAGISTAAGIGDFRGKDGKWTRNDRSKNYGTTAPAQPKRVTIMEQLRPTYTHEALCKLLEMGILKFIISQNVDGLHRLSGIDEDKISELHGNTFMERCEECNKVYVLKHHYRKGNKDSSVKPEKCKRCKISHRTGRKCTSCKGHLMNTVINFGDYLDSDVLEKAERHASMSDSVLVLGSSLKVSPADSLVIMGKQPTRLIICNRQITPYDDTCTEQGADGQLGSRVFCDCDKLMRKIMEHFLSLSDLKAWEAEREIRVSEYALSRASI